MVSEGDIQVGSRIDSDGNIATIRYIGEVLPAKGIWYGVEWDDPNRGKHDGSHEGKRYFKTDHPTSGSFLRPKKVSSGVPFWEAVQDRYGMIEDDSAGIVTEDMFVVGKNQQQTVVEIVGAKKVNTELSKFDQLQELGLRGKSISSASNTEIIRRNFPNVKELNLSTNLLSHWEKVAEICRALIKLGYLNVSENRLPLPTNAEELQDAFQNVTSLFCNRMNYNWEQVLSVVSMFTKLENLHICFNVMNQIDRLNPYLNQLRLLNLESNPIGDWTNVLVLGKLQNLETLLLNDCGLSSVQFPDVPHGKQSALFPRLQELGLHHNKITQWSPFDELNKLAMLKNLRIQHNPVTEITEIMTQDDIRYIIVAKMRHLTMLNRTDVFEAERLGAEYDYRKTFGLKWRKSGGHQDPAQNKPSSEFTQEHPRYQELIERYGPPEDSELKEQSSALKNSLISITICCPDHPDKKTISKKLPVSMSVQKLRMLVQRLYKPDPLSLKLTYSTEKMPDQIIEFESDQKEIGYYSIEDGDTVFVQW